MTAKQIKTGTSGEGIEFINTKNMKDFKKFTVLDETKKSIASDSTNGETLVSSSDYAQLQSDYKELQEKYNDLENYNKFLMDELEKRGVVFVGLSDKQIENIEKLKAGLSGRERLLKSSSYWFENVQNEVYTQVNGYMTRENLNQSQLAVKLNVSKGYISQILNGNFNFSLRKLIDLGLSIGLILKITYTKIEDEIEQDKANKELYKIRSQSEPYKSYYVIKGRYRSEPKYNSSVRRKINRI